MSAGQDSWMSEEAVDAFFTTTGSSRIRVPSRRALDAQEQEEQNSTEGDDPLDESGDARDDEIAHLAALPPLHRFDANLAPSKAVRIDWDRLSSLNESFADAAVNEAVVLDFDNVGPDGSPVRYCKMADRVIPRTGGLKWTPVQQESTTARQKRKASEAKRVAQAAAAAAEARSQDRAKRQAELAAAETEVQRRRAELDGVPVGALVKARASTPRRKDVLAADEQPLDEDIIVGGPATPAVDNNKWSVELRLQLARWICGGGDKPGNGDEFNIKFYKTVMAEQSKYFNKLAAYMQDARPGTTDKECRATWNALAVRYKAVRADESVTGGRNPDTAKLSEAVTTRFKSDGFYDVLDPVMRKQPNVAPPVQYGSPLPGPARDSSDEGRGGTNPKDARRRKREHAEQAAVAAHEFQHERNELLREGQAASTASALRLTEAVEKGMKEANQRQALEMLARYGEGEQKDRAMVALAKIAFAGFPGSVEGPQQ